SSNKNAFGDANNVRNCFKTFHPAENLARLHWTLCRGLKVIVDNLTDHSSSEFCKAHAQPKALPLLRPEMRKRVPITHRQMRLKVRPLKQQGFGRREHSGLQVKCRRKRWKGFSGSDRKCLETHSQVQ